MGKSVNDAFQDIISRVDKMDDHKNNITQQLEQQINELRDEFNRNMRQA